MTRTALWILLAWLMVSFWSGLGARISPGHLVPDAAVVTICFAGLHHKPIPAAVIAYAVGYLIDRQTGAPSGLHEVALVLCAMVVYLASDKLAGSGALFFASVCGGTLMVFHLLLFLLLLIGRGQAGFSSWATALLIPNAAVTALLGLVSYRPMLWLDHRLAEKRREGLQWR